MQQPRMIGRHIHGYNTPMEFTTQNARDAATAGWLTHRQCFAILTNPHRYQPLHVQGNNLNINQGLVMAGNEDCLFLCNLEATDNIDYTIVEEPEDVLVNDDDERYSMTLRRSFTSTFEKREYYPRHAGQKLVHYGGNNDICRQQMALAKEAATPMMTDMDNESQAAAVNRYLMADQIRHL